MTIGTGLAFIGVGGAIVGVVAFGATGAATAAMVLPVAVFGFGAIVLTSTL